MKEERTRILNMVKEGKISVEEADELISALDGRNGAAASGDGTFTGNLKYFRIVVEPVDGGHTKDRVNVRVPIALLRAGARLTTLLPQEARGKINDTLQEKGTGLTLSDLEGANLEPLLEALADMSIDVDTDDAHVRIFCE
jgi:hypothetical protein